MAIGPPRGPLRIRGFNFPHLDGVRGIAILLVMLHHFTQGHPAAGDLGQSLIFGLGELGWTGVDLFFVLSGFLITSILLESKEGKSYFGRFFSRRFLRIFPLYYASLAVVFFVLPHLGTTLPLPEPEDQSWYWLYLVNVHIALQACRRGLPDIGFGPITEWSTPGVLLSISVRLVLSVALAFASYHLFEKFFLRLKR